MTTVKWVVAKLQEINLLLSAGKGAVAKLHGDKSNFLTHGLLDLSASPDTELACLRPSGAGPIPHIDSCHRGISYCQVLSLSTMSIWCNTVNLRESNKHRFGGYHVMSPFAYFLLVGEKQWIHARDLGAEN